MRSLRISRDRLSYKNRSPLTEMYHGENDPRQEGEFGDFAEQCPFTGYEPNDLIEVGYTERVSLFFRNRASSASTLVKTPLQTS